MEKTSRCYRNYTALSSFFDIKKERPKISLEKCYQCCSVSTEISVDL